MESRCSRTRCVPAGSMAGYDPAPVLQLSRHGRARHDFYCGDGLGRVDALAPQTLRLAGDALGAMVCRSLAYIANTAGWMTAELGRQPWLIYGLMRTAQGVSPRVGPGNAWFTLIGFRGLFSGLGILWLFLVYREIEHGPEPDESLPAESAVAAATD